MTADAMTHPSGPAAGKRARPDRRYASLHGAYHRLTRRLDRELFPWQISPPEGLVLVTVQIHSPAPRLDDPPGDGHARVDALLRSWPGSRRGACSSGRGPRTTQGRSRLTLTAAGDELAGTEAVTFAEIDLELSSFTSPDERAGVAAVYEAAGAMSPSPAPFDY